MSECRRCGKELVCDQDKIVVINGKSVHVKSSAPHGCPAEFDHTQWRMNKDEANALFSFVEEEE